MKIFSHNVWNHNPVEYRNALIYSLIHETDADICMFQECGPGTSRRGAVPLAEIMKYDYTEVCPEKAYQNFTPVFYKTERFNLVDSGYFLYTGLNDADSKSVTWAVLEDKATSKRFGAVSTHFWWKYDSEADNRQRLQNVEELKKLCDCIAFQHDVAVIIGGDFNNGEKAAQGDEPYHAMLQKGFRDFRLTAKRTTSSFTHHKYPVLKENGIYADGSLPDKTLDYIFAYGKNAITIEQFDVLKTQKALDSSDHCPLVGTILL